MKHIKKWMACFAVPLLLASGMKVSAGGLNGPESALVGAAGGTFTYNGQSYVASADLLNQAINYLCQDGVDLTQEQANAAIGSMYGMVAQGVAQGYLIPVGGAPGNQQTTGGADRNTQEEPQNNTGQAGQKSPTEAVKDAAKLAGELGVKVTVDPANKKVTITNADGKQILNFDGVIKNTGIPLDFDWLFFVLLAVYAAVAVVLLALAVLGDRRQPVGKPSSTGNFVLRNICSPILMAVMGAALVGILCMPAKDLLSSTGKMILSKGVPDYEDGLDSIYDANAKRYRRSVDSDKITMPSNETHYAMIQCPSWELDEKLYFGDTDRVLENGLGQYMGSGIPGMGKPILVTGHSNTFLSGMAKVKQGDIVTIRTNYGNYKYRIYKSTIAEASDSSAYDLGLSEEQLILYTCYPYTPTVGVRTERHYVYGEKVAGPTIRYQEKERGTSDEEQ